MAHYREHVAAAEATSIVLDQVWRTPLQWMRQNIPRESKVCLHQGSEWTLSVQDLDARKTYGPFEFPYHRDEAMRRFEPPSLEQLTAACDFIVLGSFHSRFYDWRMRQVSPELAERWASLYREVAKRYPPRTFSTNLTSGPTNKVEIFDLRANAKKPKEIN